MQNILSMHTSAQNPKTMHEQRAEIERPREKREEKRSEIEGELEGGEEGKEKQNRKNERARKRKKKEKKKSQQNQFKPITTTSKQLRRHAKRTRKTTPRLRNSCAARSTCCWTRARHKDKRRGRATTHAQTHTNKYEQHRKLQRKIQ